MALAVAVACSPTVFEYRASDAAADGTGGTAGAAGDADAQASGAGGTSGGAGADAPASGTAGTIADALADVPVEAESGPPDCFTDLDCWGARCENGACAERPECTGFDPSHRLEHCAADAATCGTGLTCHSDSTILGVCAELEACTTATVGFTRCCDGKSVCGTFGFPFVGFFVTACCTPGEVALFPTSLGDISFTCDEGTLPYLCRDDSDCVGLWDLEWCIGATPSQYGACRECTVATQTLDCSSGVQTRCSAEGRCVQCTSSSQCSAPTPVCSQGGACVAS